MSTIETLYLWIAAACLLAFIAGFSSGIWATLSILRRWRQQWLIDREKSDESVFGPKPAHWSPGPEVAPPPLTVLHGDDSFERPPA